MTNKELYKYMDDLLKMHLEEQQKQACLYICNKLTKWFATNAVTVNVNNWVNDYSAGFDFVKDDVKKFCSNQKFIVAETFKSDFGSGYIRALNDVLEHLERL